MTRDCDSWTSLSDNVARGEVVTEQEKMFLTEHVTRCRECAAEARVWETLGRVLDDPSRLTEALEPAASELETSTAGRARWRSWFVKPHRLAVGAAAILGAAASIGFISGRDSRTDRGARAALPATANAAPLEPSARSRPGTARLALVAGATRLNQQPATAGEALRSGDGLKVHAGQACLLVPPAVTVCGDEGTELVVEKLDGGERRLRLDTGHVVARLGRQPRASTFGVETRAGSVVAKGTVFSVWASGQDVALRVHEGTVIESGIRGTNTLVAPRSSFLTQGSGAGVAAEPPANDDRLVELSVRFDDRSTSDLVVSAAPGGTVTLDGSFLGGTPLSALVAPGSYRLAYARNELLPVVERITLVDGATLVRNYEATGESPTTTEGERSPAPHASPASPAQLLAAARAHRAGGRFKEAAATYRRLLRERPASAEARIALVSLGELQLSELADAKGALASFDAYLRAGGGLAQEASYGRIRALRRLGRHAEERRAVEAFLTAYPNSVQAAALRKEMR